MPLGDVLDRRRLIPLITLASAVALAACALAPSFGALVAAVTLLGMTTVSGQLLTPLAGDVATDENRGAVVGTVFSGLLTGILVSRTISGLVAEAAGWRAVYASAAVLAILFAALLYRSIPSMEPKTRMRYPAPGHRSLPRHRPRDRPRARRPRRRRRSELPQRQRGRRPGRTNHHQRRRTRRRRSRRRLRPEQHPRIFDTAESELGPLDIVVSNAAIVINKPLSDYTLDDYRATFDTHTRGAFLVLQQAAARVRDNGRIIAVSTGGTRLLLAGTTLYLGSKGAVDQLVRGVAMDAGPRGITVNTVSPGFTNTDLLTDDFRATAADMSPFGRVGEPEEVAAVVTFLASPAASWVTAQNIGIGGGVM